MSRTAYAGRNDNDEDTPQVRARDLRNGMERRLISLEGHSLKQLADCRGPMDLYLELYEGIRQDLHSLDAQLEELALLAEEAGTESERGEIQGLADTLARRLSKARVSFREASLQSKRRMDQANAINQREALFAPARKGGATSKSEIAPNSSGTSKDDELMAATANVTDGLRRTRQLLEQELERSSLSTQVLERSSQTLTLTSDQYTSFAGLLQASKNIITTMQKADTLDRLLILAALLFFGLVCLLIIKRRILDRGIRAATLVSRLAGGGSAAHISKNIKSSLASGLSSVAATGTSIAASVAMSSQSTTPASKVEEPSISPASAVASAASTLSDDPALVTTIPLSLVNMEGSTSYTASESTSAAAAPTEVASTQDTLVDDAEDVALDGHSLGLDLVDDVDLAELEEEVPLDYHQDEDADTEESPRVHVVDEL